MITKTKLTFMPYAQATVIIDDNNNITLRSYATDVIYLDNEGFLTVTGLHSMTTRRHIGAFMKEYTPFDFTQAKSVMRVNINSIFTRAKLWTCKSPLFLLGLHFNTLNR